MLDQTARKERLQAAVRQEFEIDKEALESRVGMELCLEYRGYTFHIPGVARFNLVPFPNCGAAAIMCDCHVEPAYRGKGLATALHRLRLRAASRAGVTLVAMTARAGNGAACAIAGKLGYTAAGEFHNAETRQDLRMYTRVL